MHGLCWVRCLLVCLLVAFLHLFVFTCFFVSCVSYFQLHWYYRSAPEWPLCWAKCKNQKWLPPCRTVGVHDNVKSSCQRKQISKSRFAKCISVFMNRTAGVPLAVVNISSSHILTSNCYIVTIALYNLCSIVFGLFIRIYPCLQNAWGVGIANYNGTIHAAASSWAWGIFGKSS